MLHLAAVEQVIRSHNIAGDYLRGLLSMDEDRYAPESITPGPDTPVAEEEACEEQQQGLSLPPETGSAGTGEKSYIDRVMGKGYLGAEVEISRLHVCEGDLLKYENAPTPDRDMPAGMYIFRNEFFTLCGKQFTDEDKFYYKDKGWKGWVSAIGSYAFSISNYYYFN